MLMNHPLHVRAKQLRLLPPIGVDTLPTCQPQSSSSRTRWYFLRPSRGRSSSGGTAHTMTPLRPSMIQRGALGRSVVGQTCPKAPKVNLVTHDFNSCFSYAVRMPTSHPILENFRLKAFRQLLLKGRGSNASVADAASSFRTMEGDEEQLSTLGELMFFSHQSYSACGLGCHGTDRWGDVHALAF